MSVYHSMRRSLLDDNIEGDIMFINVALNPPPVTLTNAELRAVNVSAVLFILLPSLSHLNSEFDKFN